MARIDKKATPSLVKVWKEKYSIDEPQIISSIESMYPDRFENLDKLIHKEVLEIWHLSDDDEVVSSQTIIDAFEQHIADGKYYYYDKVARQDNELENRWIELLRSVHGHFMTTDDVSDFYLHDMKEMDSALIEYFNRKIKPNYRTTEEAFDQEIAEKCVFYNGDPWCKAHVKLNGDIYFTKSEYGESRKNQYGSNNSDNSGCLGLFLIPILLWSAILLC